MATKTFKIGLSNTDKQNMAQDVYERLIAMCFDEYDSSETYNTGDFVVYESPADTFKLYKCNSDNVTGAWDSSKWDLATFQDLVDDIESAVAFVNNKANVDGNYPTMTVGLANNLDTKVVQNDVDAYNFRTSGGSLEIGDTCKVKKIVGGSVGFNQCCYTNNGTKTYESGPTATINNNVIKITGECTTTGYLDLTGSNMPNALIVPRLVVDHVYLIILDDEWNAQDGYFQTEYAGIGAISKTHIHKCTRAAGYFQFRCIAGKTYDIETRIQVIDLTAMFGETIANYVLSLGDTNGFAWFKRYFNKPYYAYTTIGAFQNVKTRGKKIVGFNQWDEETRNGYFDQSGVFSPYINNLASKNPIPVIAGQTYYGYSSEYTIWCFFYDANDNYLGRANATNRTFTAPAKASYMHFCNEYGQGGTYNHNICLHFHYDGERDGEYEPYESETYACDDIELIGIPKIDAQGNLYYEGNEYNADGTVNKKYGIVDLGSLTWVKDGNHFRSYHRLEDVAIPSDNYTVANILCSKYVAGAFYYVYNEQSDKTIGIQASPSGSEQYIGVYDTSLSSGDAAAFKTAMSGIYLVYELATPTEDSATPFQETQQVDNWGTEQWLAPTSDTRPCEVPVGQDTDYLLDLKSKLEIMPDSPSADGDYVVHNESGVNEYVALGSWLSTNGYVKLTDIAGYDDTKTQTLKNVEGVLTWVDD